MKEWVTDKNGVVGACVGAVVFSVLLRQDAFAAWENTSVGLGMRGRDIGITASVVLGAAALGFVFTLVERSAVSRERGGQILLGVLGVLACLAAGAFANWVGEAWAVALVPIAAFVVSVIPAYFMG